MIPSITVVDTEALQKLMDKLNYIEQSMRTMRIDKYVNQQGAAAYLGIQSVNTFRGLEKRGLFVYFEVGGNKMYKLSDLDTGVQQFRGRYSKVRSGTPLSGAADSAAKKKLQ